MRAFFQFVLSVLFFITGLTFILMGAFSIQSAGGTVFFCGVGGLLVWKSYRLWYQASGKSPAGPPPPPFHDFLSDSAVLSVSTEAEAGEGRWYRLRHWDTRHFLRMNHACPAGWRVYLKEAPVAGVSFENREAAFFSIWQEPGLLIYLEREPDNVVDRHAIKVMGTCQTLPYAYHLGYIEKETAKKMQKAGRTDARLHAVYLPGPGRSFGLRITVWVPS